MSVLILETSTSSAKALLYDEIKGIVSTKIIPYNKEKNSIAMQDCDDVCRSVLEAGRQIAFSQDVEAIALCGTWHSIVVCDRSMKPVSPSYSWAYTDSMPEIANIRKDHRLTLDLYHRTGCMVHSTYGFYTLMHLKNSGMEFRDKLFASQAGYIFYTMTGERVESSSTMAGTSLLNVHSKQYDPFILSMLGLDAEQFGRLVTYRDTYPLLKNIADALGVKPGIPVVPAYPDGAMNQVGSGALEYGIMTMSVGTSAALRFTVDKPMIPEEPSTWCYVGVDSWVSGAAISGAGSCVDWLRRSVFNGNMSFKTLESAAASQESTPVFLPFVFGERSPGWQDDRLGGFFDVRPQHDYGSMYRGLLEGICFNLRQCYSLLTSIAGEPKEIRLSGGIINSPFWTQMLSDVLGRELYVSRFDQASSLGSVALALFALGKLAKLSDFKVDSYTKVLPRESQEYKNKYERYLYWYNLTR